VKILFSVVLLAMGCTIPLLLNGQPFTNSLIGLFCTIGSAGLAFASRQVEPTWLWKPVAAMAIVLCVVLLSLLPSSLRTQQRFNATRDKIHQNQHVE
jgi:hypothetical protein